MILRTFKNIQIEKLFRNSDKIADLERKINGYRLSRDDELKNVITLETRLNDCREDSKKLHEKITNSGCSLFVIINLSDNTI